MTDLTFTIYFIAWMLFTEAYWLSCLFMYLRLLYFSLVRNVLYVICMLMQCAIDLINHCDLIWSDDPPFIAKYQTQKELNCFSWCLLNWHRRTWHLSHRHSYIGTSGMILPLQCCQFAAKTHFDIQQDDRLWLLMEWRPDGGSKFRDCTLRCCQTFLVVWLIQAEAGNLERHSPSVIWSTTLYMYTV